MGAGPGDRDCAAHSTARACGEKGEATEKIDDCLGLRRAALKSRAQSMIEALDLHAV